MYNINLDPTTKGIIYRVGGVRMKSLSGTTTTTTTTSSGLVLGQQMSGGTIVMFFSTGDSMYVSGQQHGIIMQSGYTSTNCTWGCYGTSISTSDNICSGSGNTINIVNGCATAGIAARLCSDLNYGGYTDWFLPSRFELSTILTNRLTNTNIQAIIPNYEYYWTSSQYNENFGYYGGWFGDNVDSFDSKSINYKVKSCRYF